MTEKQKNIPVYFVTNWDMVGYTATTMASILCNTKHNVDFYVMDCGLSDFDRKQLSTLKERFSNFKSLSFAKANMTRFKGLSTWYYGLLDAWAMLLFPEAFPNVHGKVIHVESDTLVVDDIVKLYNEDMKGYAFAGCPDIAFSNNRKVFSNIKYKYFNLGMAIIDCDKWREQNITTQALELGKKYGKIFGCLHQDALNMLFDGNYCCLPSRYNLGERENYVKELHSDLSEEYFAEEWQHPVIIHFSPNKPWRSQNNTYSHRIAKYFNEWWYYAAMTPYIEGLRNCFISSKISDGFKGFQTGMTDYGNNMLDTLANPIFSDLSNEKSFDYKMKYSILGLPILKVLYSKNGSKIYKLFSILPFWQLRKDSKGNNIYKLFGVLPILRIKQGKGK